MDLGNYFNNNSQAEAAMSRITQESGANLLQRKNEASSRDVVDRLNQRDAEDHINQAFNAIDEGIIVKGLTGKGSSFIRNKLSKGVSNYILKPVKGKLVNYAKGTDSLTEDLRNLPENLKSGVKGIGQQISDNIETYGKGLRDVGEKFSGVADDVGDEAGEIASKAGGYVERTGIQRVMPQLKRLGNGLRQRIQNANAGQSRGMNNARDINEAGDPDQADQLHSENPFDPAENPTSADGEAGSLVEDLGDSGGSLFDSPAKLILPDDTGSLNTIDGGIRDITNTSIETPPTDELPTHLGGGSTQYGTAGDATNSVEEAASKGGVADGTEVAEEDAGGESWGQYFDRYGEAVDMNDAGEEASQAAKGAAQAAGEAGEGLDEAITSGAGPAAQDVAQGAAQGAEEATEGLGRTIGRAVMKKAAQAATKTAIDAASKAASKAATVASDIADGVGDAVDAADVVGEAADVVAAPIPGADILTDLGTMAMAGAGFGLEKLADWIEKKTSGPDDTAASVVGTVMRTHLGATQTHLMQ